MTNTEKLQVVLRTVLALPADLDLAAVSYGSTETWDSVAHMQLVLAVEEAFGITLDADDVVEMSSYAAAIRLLREHHGLALDG